MKPYGHPATYLGSGSVETVKACCLAEDAHSVFINAPLSGIQQRNLEQLLGVRILDRVNLIISIFAQRAATKEARLQVELARLQYLMSRLVRSVSSSGQREGFGDDGQTQVVSARQRGRSGGESGGLGGGGGSGESELQMQRSRLMVKRKALEKQLKEVQKTRQVQRAGRKRAGIPVVALVGYTNAGKSSLLSALSGSHVKAADRLFETLDPTLRRVMLPSCMPVVMADTVGFIRDLPLQLIQAFKATLEEVTFADVVVHVVDASAATAASQRRAVVQVLSQLGMSEDRLRHDVIEVFNKIDLLPSEVRELLPARLFKPPQKRITAITLASAPEGRHQCQQGVQRATTAASLPFLGDCSGDTQLQRLEADEQEFEDMDEGREDQFPSAEVQIAVSVRQGQGLDLILQAVQHKLMERGYGVDISKDIAAQAA